MGEAIEGTHGINQDVKVEERVLHVQTEDLGLGQKEILTIVYSAGEIVFSCRNPYSFFEQKFGHLHLDHQGMVNMQHSGIVKGVRTGRLAKQKGSVNRERLPFSPSGMGIWAWQHLIEGLRLLP